METYLTSSLAADIERGLIDLERSDDLVFKTSIQTIARYLTQKVLNNQSFKDVVSGRDVTITPEMVNGALKSFEDDGVRLLALKGICGCGNVKNEGPCWSCYESTWE